ncbi:MAG: hypothetical protein B6245_19010 [Desulfobacteraceae bacterium 4572_88]|nr:MAG: hypothetical protein B6245_19010 [Desulfobacteraceae bacterium 4572_88]
MPAMKFRISDKDRLRRLLGLILLFAVIAWAFYIHLPTLNEGYLNAGDDHVHVAFSNELSQIWSGEGKALGWSRLYASGAPIFLLRPPGLYTAVCAVHFLTGLSVEQSLKVVVLFGFCLYPLAIFIGGRLLGLGFGASLFAGMLAPLPISLWGHTIDAYQYLGIHKQLLAILIFPIATGALWRLLKDGKYGLMFALLFAMMFMTHPYIAYCFALLVPCMLIALVSIEPQWNWKQGILKTTLWSVPAVLLLSIWLIPFVSSQEIQVADPFLSRRKSFDVVVCTTAETFRQFFLGGILDTTRFADPFGGTDWIAGNEWGWRSNRMWFRFPILSLLAFVGWLITVIRPRSAVRGFLGLAFLLASLLFIGPDDFPFLDWIPNAKKFQNVHAIFIFEWAAITLGGVACHWLFRRSSQIPKIALRYALYAVLAAPLIWGYGTAIYERTETGKLLNTVRNIHTVNGELSLRPGMFDQFRFANDIVNELRASDTDGNITAFPQKHNDSVFYNLLPLMVNRPVFLTGFETVGGVYDLLLHKFRTSLRDNYPLQKLFNIRFVLNSPFYRKEEMAWHDAIEPVRKNQYWELVRVRGDFGALALLPPGFIGFVGSEREWTHLMELWLSAVRNGESALPWIINLTHSGLSEKNIHQIKPLMKFFILGSEAEVPRILDEIKHVGYDFLGKNPIASLKKRFASDDNIQATGNEEADSVPYEILKADRASEIFRVSVGEPLSPLLFKRTFYRGWACFIDGEKVPIYRVSPGLQMVMVPQGKHLIRWHYTGPNHWGWASAAFWSAFFIVAILLWEKRIGGYGCQILKLKAETEGLKVENQESEPRTQTRARRLLPYIPSAIWLLFLGIFIFQSLSEAYFKIPVLILPQSGQEVEAGQADFYWNYIVGIPKSQQRFHLEIARDREFRKIVGTQSESSDHIRVKKVFTNKGTYYYRVRLESKGKIYGWSRTVRVVSRGEK